jgi:hypothetical protein
MNKPTLPSTRVYPEIHISRRRFVKSLLVTWASASSLTWPLAMAERAPTSADSPAWLLATTGDPSAASRLGQAYLATRPDEHDVDLLTGLIEERLSQSAGPNSARLERPADIAKALMRLVRTDYIQNNVINLEGWVLSQTEARLYALSAVLHNA